MVLPNRMALSWISTNHDECLPAVYSLPSRLWDSTGTRDRPCRQKRKKRPGQAGSASVEFAAVLPLVAIAMLAVVQVSLIAWDQMRLAHAAREGARALAVFNDAGAVKDAVARAGDFDQNQLDVQIGPSQRPAGTPSSVTVLYRPPIVVPYIGRFVPEVTLRAIAWIRVERDPP